MAKDNTLELAIKVKKEGTGFEDFTKAFSNFKGETEKLKTSVSSLGNSLSKHLGSAAIGAALVAGFVYAVKEASDAEKALNSLKSAVEISGGSWNVLGKAMEDYAAKLQSTTTYSDEQVMDVMQRIVTITGNVNEGWKQTGLVLDMASTGMISAETAAKAVSFAMEGNITALGRLLPELKGLDKQLGENATKAEKTEAAMAILNETFGGRAAAEAGTYAGQMKQVQNAFSDLAESVGMVLLPFLKAMLPYLKMIAERLKEQADLWKFILDPIKEEKRLIRENVSEWVLYQKELKETGKITEDQYQKRINLAIKQGTFTKKELEDITGITEKKKEAAQQQKEAKEKQIKAEQKIVDDFHKKYEEIIKATTAKTIAELDKQRKYYEKHGAQKLELDAWYKIKKDQILEDESKKQVEVLKKRAGEDLSYYLNLLTQEQQSTVDKSAAWMVYRDEVNKVQEEINTKNMELVQGIVSRHSFDLIEGIRTGNKGIETIFNDLVQDIIQTWEKMIADMIAKWVTSQLFEGMNINVTGGGAGGGAGGSGGKNVLGDAGKIAKDTIEFVTNPIAKVGDWIGDFTGWWAEGGIATKPSIVGIGEAGPEAIVPLDRLDQFVPRTQSRSQVINNYHLEIKAGALMGNKAEAQEFAKMIDTNLEILRRTGRSVALAGI